MEGVATKIFISPLLGGSNFALGRGTVFWGVSLWASPPYPSPCPCVEAIHTTCLYVCANSKNEAIRQTARKYFMKTTKVSESSETLPINLFEQSVVLLHSHEHFPLLLSNSPDPFLIGQLSRDEGGKEGEGRGGESQGSAAAKAGGRRTRHSISLFSDLHIFPLVMQEMIPHRRPSKNQFSVKLLIHLIPRLGERGC